MKKSLLIIAALLLATSLVWAVPITGSPSVSDNVVITVTIPARVGIDITTNAYTLNMGIAGYPPAAATYYSIGATNLIKIFSNATYNFSYACAFAAGTTGLTIGKLEYQGTGPNGWTPALPWTAFAATGVLQATPHVKTAGWESRNLDYQVNLNGAEIPGSAVWTVTYTVATP